MNANQKKQRQQQRTSDRRMKQIKIVIIAVIALAALGWAIRSMTPPADSKAASADAAFPTISIEEFKQQYDRGEVTVIDTRTAEQFVVSHIPGSLQIPFTRIENEIPYLPKDKPIVAYCTCPAEETSGAAVQILRSKGVMNATALKGGLDAWIRKGYPLETGAAKN